MSRRENSCFVRFRAYPWSLVSDLTHGSWKSRKLLNRRTRRHTAPVRGVFDGRSVPEKHQADLLTIRTPRLDRLRREHTASAGILVTARASQENRIDPSTSSAAHIPQTRVVSAFAIETLGYDRRVLRHPEPTTAVGPLGPQETSVWLRSVPSWPERTPRSTTTYLLMPANPASVGRPCGRRRSYGLPESLLAAPPIPLSRSQISMHSARRASRFPSATRKYADWRRRGTEPTKIEQFQRPGSGLQPSSGTTRISAGE